jgi:glycosyltransferase 2 family protein
VSLQVSKKKLLFKGIVSLAFFLILISFVQGNQLALMFSQIDWVYLFLSLVLSPVMIVVSCLKWKMILDAGGSCIPFATLFRIYLIGYFFSNMLPSTVGGDVVRSYYAGKLINDQSYSAIAIFIERFSGIFFLFFLVILAPLLVPTLYQSPYVLVPIAASFSLIVITLWIGRVKNPYTLPNKIVALTLNVLEKVLSFVRYKKSEHLLTAINRQYQSFMARVEKLHDKLRLALGTIQQDKKLLCQLILITALFYFLTWVNVSVAFMAFGVDHQFFHICALVPTILFVAHFPVTLLGNLGFFESVFVFYLLIIGIPATASLAMGLLLRMKMLLIGIVGFFVYLAYKQKTGDDAKKLSEKTNMNL